MTTSAFPPVTKTEWRAQVDKELAGKSFERTLVTETIEGLSVEPLYTEAPNRLPLGEVRAPFRICMRHGAEATEAEIASDVENGADAAWLGGDLFVLDGKRTTLPLISTVSDHEAGADAATEIAIALSSLVAHLRANGASNLSAQVAVGQDTFLELCKLRALRACWQKVLTASGVTAPTKTLVHAVCSARTLTVRDPWVNMLRVTTQVTAAVLGGADLVTPATYDQAFGTSSAQARRIARNTGLVLREESFLGKVSDPAGGSYYLETLTDALAREAWKRFQAIEKDGGIAEARKNGSIAAAIEATWKTRLDRIVKRKTPILGVSEFANLTETLPHALPANPTRRDASAFETLRTKADAMTTPPEALLLTLGPLAESRPRAGFATGFFAAGGIRSRESDKVDGATSLACICGSDERYATEAVAKARELKAAGVKRVMLAGRPGALEPQLREAGVDGFLYVGCDVVTTLADLLDTWS